MRSNSESPIERQILAYLVSNPAAQDTIRGIMEWWLLKQQIVDTQSAVEKALASLVAKGELIAEVRADGQVSYRLQQNVAYGPN